MQKRLDISLWTALVTPLDHHSLIDESTMETLIERQENANNGILLLGSTGEGLAIQLDDKKRLLERVLRKERKVPVMIGVGGYNLPEQLQWVRFCQKLPIDALLLTTPIYAKPGDHGQTEWFKAIMDVATVPCMLYNHPYRSGIALSVKACENLREHPNFWAIKDASSSVERFREFKKAVPEKMIFSGCDDMMSKLGPEGVQGLIGVMPNVWPEGTKQYVHESLAGNKSGLYPSFEAGAAIANQLNPVSAKKLLFAKGITSNELVLPPLSPKDVNLPEDWKEVDQALSNPLLGARALG